MSSKKVFYDEEGNEMDCFVNTKGDLYIGISLPGEDGIYGGHIILKKQDVKEFIKILQDFQEDVNEK